jgi:hypothetical protein
MAFVESSVPVGSHHPIAFLSSGSPSSRLPSGRVRVMVARSDEADGVPVQPPPWRDRLTSFDALVIMTH